MYNTLHKVHQDGNLSKWNKPFLTHLKPQTKVTVFFSSYLFNCLTHLICVSTFRFSTDDYVTVRYKTRRGINNDIKINIQTNFMYLLYTTNLLIIITCVYYQCSFCTDHKLKCLILIALYRSPHPRRSLPVQVKRIFIRTGTELWFRLFDKVQHIGSSTNAIARKQF